MKPQRPSTKKLTAENLVGLGAERLADILVGVAETRPDLKRRLRMELAAEQGPAPLAAEIDRRLASFETSRGQVTWRQRPAFLRDLDALRGLISDRLAPLDGGAAVERLWRFMDTARQVGSRYRERGGELDAIFLRAAGNLGRLLANAAAGAAAAALVDHLAKDPSGWKSWLPDFLADAPASLAVEALRFMSERRGAVPGWTSLIRQLADAGADVEAYRATYTEGALKTPSVAAQIGRRFLAAGRTDEAGEVLRTAAADPRILGNGVAPDFDWETVWIDYLDQTGQSESAQAARWASFERSLSIARARDFVGRLADFDDVEAEARAFAYAAQHSDFERGLRFLMAWPAYAAAARMILARPDEVRAGPEEAEAWAAKLRRRHPNAAHLLLRKAAAAAFRRRDFKTCDLLTQEAETIDP